MISWLAKKLLTYNMNRLNAGDIEPTLRLDAEDVQFIFPGDNSWSGHFNGKRELRPWLERFTRVGLHSVIDEVAVTGFPWRQTVCLRGHDHLRASDGELVYENRYVIWGHVRWGRLREYELYEDTQKSRALDAYLEQHEAPVPAVR